MTSIKLVNANVDFPVFDGQSRSLKNEVLKIATGGAIGKSANGSLFVRGLDDVSLEIKERERIGLIGDNGAGKTTLLKVLSGIYYPTTGSYEISGDCFSLINPSLGIDPEATGKENIRLRTAMMGVGKSQLSHLYDQIAEFTELGDFLNMPFRTYSSGMQMRLAFSISTIFQPEILVMDEWLSTGDEGFREKANQRLQEIIDSTKIMILASHSRDLLAVNCNRVIWMEHGKIKMDGPTDEVLDVYFKSTNKQSKI